MPHVVNQVAPISQLLSNVAVAYKNAAFVAEDILPVVNVPHERFTYFIFGRHHFRRISTLRAVASAYQRVDYALKTATGTCEEYGLEHPIDDRIRAEAVAPLEPDVQGTTIVTELLRLDQEKRVATLLTTASNYNSALVNSPTTKWSNENATVHKNVMDAMEAVRQQIGQYPNTWLIPAKVAAALSQTKDITDYVKNTVGLAALEKADPLKGYLLPRHIWGLQVIIAGAIENTANLQQRENMSDIWGENSIIAYVPERPARFTPALGYIFRRSGNAIQIERYREEATRSTIIRGYMIQDEVLVAQDDNGKAIAGFLYTDVI